MNLPKNIDLMEEGAVTQSIGFYAMNFNRSYSKGVVPISTECADL